MAAKAPSAPAAPSTAPAAFESGVKPVGAVGVTPTAAETGLTSSLSKWILPVAIGGGVLLVLWLLFRNTGGGDDDDDED